MTPGPAFDLVIRVFEIFCKCLIGFVVVVLGVLLALRISGLWDGQLH